MNFVFYDAVPCGKRNEDREGTELWFNIFITNLREPLAK
jgi:hypothetical protein